MKRIAGIGKGTIVRPTVTGGIAYANGFVVLAEGLDMFRLGAVATGGNMNLSGNLSFTKINLVGWISDS
jgi:hypothetical protein